MWDAYLFELNSHCTMLRNDTLGLLMVHNIIFFLSLSDKRH